MAPRTPRSSPSKTRKAAPKTPKPDSKDRYGTFSDAPARIAVIGVGGGGCNAVTRMLEAKPIPGVQYAVVNTDIKSLRTARLAQKIQIGEVLTRGMGAGGNPEVGAQAAEAERDALRKLFDQTDLVFLAAGMGGGTGTGAAPVVANFAKESGALVIGVVTTPFSFEGARRFDTALSGVRSIRDQVDNLIVIHNDRLLSLLDDDVSMEDALRCADDAVTQGVHSVAELVNLPGEINVDLADVMSIMHLPGQALMAIGESQGPGSALDAAREAVSNPLLDLSIDGAKGVLFNVKAGPDLKLSEVNTAGEYIGSRVDPDAMIFFGMAYDPSLEDRAQITVIATGIGTDGISGPGTKGMAVPSWEIAGSGQVPDLDLPPFLRNPQRKSYNRP